MTDQEVLEDLKKEMEKTLGVFRRELGRTRTGRASTALLEGIQASRLKLEEQQRTVQYALDDNAAEVARRVTAAASLEAVKARGRWYVKALALLLSLAFLAGCPGTGGKVSCTKGPDGVSCTVEAHRDGKHGP